MDFIRNINNREMTIFFILPCILSALFAATGKLWILAVYMAALLLGITVIPDFHGKENCAMYALLSLSSIPANLAMVIGAVNSELVENMSGGIFFVTLLWGVLLYAMIFSLEQIAMGVLVRIIWPIQRPLKAQRKTDKEIG